MDRKRNNREGMFIVLCLLAPTLLCVWYIQTFGVNVVCADEWAFFSFLKQFNDGTFNPYALFSLSYNDHRAFFPIMYLLSIAPPLSYNEIAIEYLCLPILVGTSAIALLLADKRLEKIPFRRLILLVMAFFMLDLKQWDNMIVNFSGSTVSPPFFYAISVFLLDTLSTRLEWRLPAAVMSAFCATFSSASGLLSFPLGLLQVGGESFFKIKDEPFRKAFIRPFVWIFSSLAVIAYYFATYPGVRKSFAGTPSFEYMKNNPFDALQLFLACIANPLAGDSFTAFACGLSLICLVAVIGWMVVTGKWRLTRQSFAPLSFMCFGLTTSCLIFVGRSGMGILGVLTPRYASLTNLGIVGLLLLIATIESIRRETKLMLIAAITYAMFATTASSACSSLISGEMVHDMRLNAASALFNYKVAPLQDLMHVNPFPGIIKMWAPYLESRKYNVFEKDPTNLTGLIQTDEPPIFEVEKITVETPVEIFDDAPELKPENAVKIRGFAFDLKHRIPSDRVLVEVDGKRRFLAAYGLSRRDVCARYRRGSYMRTGFQLGLRSDVFSKGVHTVRLIIVNRDGKSYFHTWPVGQFKI